MPIKALPTARELIAEVHALNRQINTGMRTLPKAQFDDLVRRRDIAQSRLDKVAKQIGGNIHTDRATIHGALHPGAQARRGTYQSDEHAAKARKDDFDARVRASQAITDEMLRGGRS